MTPLSPPSALCDEDLAARAARRDSAHLPAAREACQELYRRYSRRLLAFLTARVARPDVEDVHHAVWVRVWEHLQGGFDGRNFRAWLHQIARNLAADQFRRRRQEPLDADHEQMDPHPDAQPLAVLLERERRLLLERCLGRLNARLLELVRGRLAGESYDELCPRLGLTPAQAHKLFHTAKAALRDCVQEGST